MNPTDAYRKELRKKELKRVFITFALIFEVFFAPALISRVFIWSLTDKIQFNLLF